MSIESAAPPLQLPEHAEAIARNPTAAPRKEEAPDRSREEPEKKHSSNAEEKKKPGEKNEARRPSKWVFIIGGLILIAAITAGVMYYIHTLHFASTDDAYTTGHTHEISSRIAGTVQDVKVDDNQKVKAGQVLVTLDPRDNEVAVQRAKAQLSQSQAQVTNAQASILQAQGDLAQREAQTAQAEAQLQKAKLDFDRTNGLFQKDQKSVAKADVDATRAQLETSQASVRAAKANVLVSQAMLRSANAQLDVAKATEASSAAALHDAELQLSYCTIPAPVDGYIAKKTVESGQRVQPGQALMAVVESNVWVVANLKETQLEKVHPGQHTVVTIDSLPHHKFQAHVDSLQSGTGATFALLPPDNATGNFTKIVQRLPVKIVFEEDSVRDFRDKIVPGLSCEPEIDLRDSSK